MAKVSSLFAPVVATISPSGGSVPPGTVVTLDTNIAAQILFTLDGSIPKLGEVGTHAADAPVQILLAIPATIKFQAIDSLRPANYTKVQSAVFTMKRNNPLEVFRDSKHFFNKLRTAIVDDNFYTAVASSEWTVPKSSIPYTFLFTNPESIPVQTRVLLNGVDTRTDVFPILGPGGSAEFGMVIKVAGNVIEVQTHQSIGS